MFKGIGFGDFTSRDYSAIEGRIVGNITTTTVPFKSSDAPEPATLALFASAFPALGLWRFARTRRK